VRDILLGNRALNRGYFRKPAVEALLARFAQGAPLAKEVFSLVVLELCQEQFLSAGPSERRAPSVSLELTSDRA
jgi:hypothetical protein